MKNYRIYKISLFVITIFVSVYVFAQENTLNYDNEIKKTSYAIGVDVARSFIERGFNIDYEILMDGFKDVYSGREIKISDDDIQKIVREHKMKLAKREAQKRKENTAKNKKEGNAFLTENRKKNGILVYEDGLQYKIIKLGDGKIPTEDDIVEVQYKGSLIDGTVIASTYIAGNPETIPVRNTIPGMKEALINMPVDSKWIIYIPSELAYGEQGAGPVEPGSMVIYEIELLSIKK